MTFGYVISQPEPVRSMEGVRSHNPTFGPGGALWTGAAE
jgi:hypothetical protein